jgi:hypothetical protein
MFAKILGSLWYSLQLIPKYNSYIKLQPLYAPSDVPSLLELFKPYLKHHGIQYESNQ